MTNVINLLDYKNNRPKGMNNVQTQVAKHKLTDIEKLYKDYYKELNGGNNYEG